MNAPTRGALIVGWWLLLAALAAFVSSHIRVSGDLRDFMPPAQTDDQKLLMDEIGNGPASQLLLVAIGGASEEQLAKLSTSLTQALKNDTNFARIINGANADLQLDSSLLPYRYLLSPTLDSETFDAKFLHDELQERVADVASPAADLLNDLLPRDPTWKYSSSHNAGRRRKRRPCAMASGSPRAAKRCCSRRPPAPRSIPARKPQRSPT